MNISSSGQELNSEDVGYVAPELVPIGSLHDLLAGDGGTQCDNMSAEVTGGHDNGQAPNC